MKIAVLSDIHDNIWNLEKVLKRLKKEKCEAIIFCGDYCAPFVVKLILELKLPTYAIFGNVDGAHYEITKLTVDLPFYHQFKEMAEIELNKKIIAICHHPKLAYGLATTGEYDVVFYGHTHKAEQKTIRKTLLANPGEIHGGMGRVLFGIYNIDSGKFEIIEVK
jgi:putative phosphoesterase